SETPSLKTVRLNSSHSLVTIQAANRLTHSLLYSNSLLCHVLLIITLSAVWRI
ncbi:BgTH12-05904, partial [Blumeria graminis f. sp. triticale]